MEVYFLSLSRFWVVLGSWVVDRSMDRWIDRYPSAAQRARPFIPFCPLESRSFGSMFVTIYATLLVLYADLHPSFSYSSHSCLLICFGSFQFSLLALFSASIVNVV